LILSVQFLEHVIIVSNTIEASSIFISLVLVPVPVPVLVLFPDSGFFCFRILDCFYGPTSRLLWEFDHLLAIRKCIILLTTRRKEKRKNEDLLSPKGKSLNIIQKG